MFSVLQRIYLNRSSKVLRTKNCRRTSANGREKTDCEIWTENRREKSIFLKQEWKVLNADPECASLAGPLRTN